MIPSIRQPQACKRLSGVSGRPFGRLLIIIALLGGLSACATSSPVTDAEGIGYRQARHADVLAMREYRACRDHGITLNQAARGAREPGRYLAAARVLEGCEADLGQAAASLALEERMRAMALAVQARLKGGDLSGARAALERFETAFERRDLYFEDGTSFIDSTEALLSAGGQGAKAAPSTANVPSALADELRRVSEWRRK